jgi:hypothetical protein
MTSVNDDSKAPQSPFSPAMEGFQVLLLGGAAGPEAAAGILAAVDEPEASDDPSFSADPASRGRPVS